MHLLPILKPGHWEGPARGAQAHRWLGSAEDPLVYVAYVGENDDELTYVTRKKAKDLDAMVRQAFENLEDYNVDFEVVDANGSQLVVAAGRPFASERVLSESHMLDVHRALDADELLVSVPRRGSMVAWARDCSDEVRTTMVNLHLEQ